METSRLKDLESVLAEVRTWDGIEDRGGGIFYLRRRPFLHFHASADRRRADVRRADGWVQVDLPEPASDASIGRLLGLLSEEHAARR